MLRLQTHYKAVAIFLFVLTLGVLSGGKAHAASITVNTDTNSSPCTLDEAIENINDHARTNTNCVETGSYLTNDTIIIPQGKVLLAADLPQITESVTIQGAGMGETVIDGDGQWVALDVLLSSGNFSLTGLTVTAFSEEGVRIRNPEVTTISKVEIDGTNVATLDGFLQTLSVDNDASYGSTVNMSDIYVHDFDVDANILQGMVIGSSGQSESSVTVTRVTIARLRNTGATQTALLGTLSGNNSGSEQFTANVTNMTVHDITSETSVVFGVMIINVANLSMVPMLNISNSTIDKVTTPDGLPFDFPILAAGAMAVNSGETASSEMHASNIMISRTEGSSTNCGVVDLGPFNSGAGVGTGTITSTGGNLSDDTTCSPYFTQPSDQNNLTTLNSTLGSLSNNGGFVPTIPLLQGSPAIDSGVTVAGLTTDARLAARPQGSAYDSGAYESSFSKATKTSATLASTGQNTTPYVLTGFAMLVLATGAITLNRRTNN